MSETNIIELRKTKTKAQTNKQYMDELFKEYVGLNSTLKERFCIFEDGYKACVDDIRLRLEDYSEYDSLEAALNAFIKDTGL